MEPFGTATGWFSTRHGGLFAATLTGEIDSMVGPELDALVGLFLAGRYASATVDLRAVTFFGSTGLNFLAALQDIAHERGGSVALVGPSRVCRRTLAIVGFDTTFDVVA